MDIDARLSNQCVKKQGYASKKELFSGIMGTDGFTFTTEDNRKRLVPEVLFGCANNCKDIRDVDNSQMNGVFGIGYF